MAKSLFPLGHIVSTPGALSAMQETRDNPQTYLRRHITGDWDNLDEHDREENEFSVNRDLRIFSAYHLSDGTKIWIITEADRSATTFLLPSEY